MAMGIKALSMVLIIALVGCAGASHIHIEAEDVVVDPGIIRTYVPYIKAKKLTLDHYIGAEVKRSDENE